MKQIKISPSSIPGAGMGLFAEEDISKGELIVEISGNRYSPKEVEELGFTAYLLDCGDGTNECIDVRGPAMYANDACGMTRVPGTSNNSVFRAQHDNSMWLEATKPIKMGQEIFASYGRAYWAAIKHHYKQQSFTGAHV